MAVSAVCVAANVATSVCANQPDGGVGRHCEGTIPHAPATIPGVPGGDDKAEPLVAETPLGTTGRLFKRPRSAQYVYIDINYVNIGGFERYAITSRAMKIHGAFTAEP
jgi:hypothetical protein